MNNTGKRTIIELDETELLFLHSAVEFYAPTNDDDSNRREAMLFVLEKAEDNFK